MKDYSVENRIASGETTVHDVHLVRAAIIIVGIAAFLLGTFVP